MPIDMTLEQLRSLLRELCMLPRETEWVESKRNADVKKVDWLYSTHWFLPGLDG